MLLFYYEYGSPVYGLASGSSYMRVFMVHAEIFKLVIMSSSHFADSLVQKSNCWFRLICEYEWYYQCHDLSILQY